MPAVRCPQPVVVDGVRRQAGDRFGSHRRLARTPGHFAAGGALTQRFRFPVFKPVARARPFGGDRARERDVGSTDSRDTLGAEERHRDGRRERAHAFAGRARTARVFDDQAIVVCGSGFKARDVHARDGA